MLDGRDEDGDGKGRWEPEMSSLTLSPSNGGDYTAIDDEEMKTRKMKRPRTEETEEKLKTELSKGKTSYS